MPCASVDTDATTSCKDTKVNMSNVCFNFLINLIGKEKVFQLEDCLIDNRS